MERAEIDAVVIGAGVIGLACARRLALAGIDTLILEAESEIGTGISARNSEVIHAGIYYPTGSLKARLCVAGRQMLHEYCVVHGVSAKRVGKLVEFFQNFADRCHHSKEEDQLFVRMERRGVPVEGGPISVMLLEHDEGRRHVAAIAKAVSAAAAGNGSAVATVRQNLLAYAELLRRHIEKEDNILYPMADQILTAEDQQELAEGFERIEAQEIGKGVHEKYHRLAHELSQL